MSSLWAEFANPNNNPIPFIPFIITLHMDPFTTPIKRSTLHEGRHVFTKAEVMDFIDSFDFPDIEITSEVGMSGDEVKSEPFVKSFFEALAAVILKRSPPKMSPKKLIEKMHEIEYESPLRSKYSKPLMRPLHGTILK